MLQPYLEGRSFAVLLMCFELQLLTQLTLLLYLPACLRYLQLLRAVTADL